MIDPTQCKARCILASAPRCDPCTEIWSDGSPTLLENREVSEIPDILPKADGFPTTLKVNTEGNDPKATGKENDSAAAMKAPIAGTKAALEAPIAGICEKAYTLPKLKEQNIDGETSTRDPDPENLSQALVVKNMEASKEPDEAKGEIAASQARMRDDLVAQTKEKLASLFYATAGQSHTKELKIGRMKATQTTESGQTLSATTPDSELITVGQKTASKVAATFQSTPVSLETTHEAWLVMHKPDRNAHIAAHQAILDRDMADIRREVEADRAAFRSRLEQEKERFQSCLMSHKLKDLEAEKARLRADITDLERNLGKKSARAEEQPASSRT